MIKAINKYIMYNLAMKIIREIEERPSISHALEISYNKHI
jgi:hypothetical protein